MSTNQRKLLFAVAACTLVIGLQSFAAADPQVDCSKNTQKCQTERWKIMQDTQTKIQKTLAPKGSTGPTVPPKPTQGNVHR